MVHQSGATPGQTQVFIFTDKAAELSLDLPQFLPQFEPAHIQHPSIQAFWEAVLGGQGSRLIVIAGGSEPVWGIELTQLRRSLRELEGSLTESLRQQTASLVTRWRQASPTRLVVQESEGRFSRFEPVSAMLNQLTRWLEVSPNPAALSEAHDRLFRANWGVGALLLHTGIHDWGHQAPKAIALKSAHIPDLNPDAMHNLIGERSLVKPEVWISTPAIEFSAYCMSQIAARWDLGPRDFVVPSLGGYHPMLNAAEFLSSVVARPSVFVGCDEALRFHAVTVGAM